VTSEVASVLAGQGVVVVSGLATGIDAAAHAGVVRGTDGSGAPPVAVAGTGLDVPYPSHQMGLWAEVASRGVIFSESALGTPSSPGTVWARSRVIAALSDVVVVVECHRNGESIHTVEAAARRSIPVCAVPGSVRSRASDGTNQLLVDGCAPVRDATDVIVALGLACVGRGRVEGIPRMDGAEEVAGIGAGDAGLLPAGDRATTSGGREYDDASRGSPGSLSVAR
jgi:DNA processing protein